MKAVYNSYHQKGFTTINPYFFTKNPQELIDFPKKVFKAEEINR